MNSVEQNAQKFYDKILKDFIVYDEPEIEYFNQSTNPESNIALSVFVSSCDWYRARIPYFNFGEAGGSVNICFPKHSDQIKYIPKSNFMIASKVMYHEYFLQIRQLANENNSTLIFDIDDNFHEIPDYNRAFDWYNKEQENCINNLKQVEEHIKISDYIFYSTRELQAYYKDLNPNGTVIPNYLDLDLRYKNLKTIDWKSLAKEQSCNVTDESILIGFFGSESHYDDLEILEEPIKRILDEYKNVIFCVMGGYVLPLSVICNKWKLPFNKFLFLPIKQIHDYPSYVNCFDIGLAPLQKTVFNRGKSNLKLIEYGALGIPYVASKVANFQRFQTESKAIGGFTCDSTEEWYRSIKFLIENPEKRKSFGQELKDYVYKEYDVKNSLGLLMNVFDTIQYNKTTKRFKKPNFYEMSDSINNIPPVKEVYTHKDKCPCGSDDLYVNCKNNCYPAWGLVVE